MELSLTSFRHLFIIWSARLVIFRYRNVTYNYWYCILYIGNVMTFVEHKMLQAFLEILEMKISIIPKQLQFRSNTFVSSERCLII